MIPILLVRLLISDWQDLGTPPGENLLLLTNQPARHCNKNSKTLHYTSKKDEKPNWTAKKL